MTSNDATDVDLNDYHYLVKPCEVYKDEYKDCKSIRARFHQIFVKGDTVNCESWNTDYENCMKFRKTGDKDALNEVAKGEFTRRLEREVARKATSEVWTLRTEPPSESEWSPPLLSHLEEKVRKSNVVNEEILPDEDDEESSLCTLQ